MYVAVRFAAAGEELPEGLPRDWPMEIRELGAADPTPPGPWISMLHVEYLEYRANRQAQYDAWKASYVPEVEPSEP